ncbi:hypothetical protein HI914_04309 [Erysiphe necator]|nr:hypothetical protein HI914_04309 [Erysiphe necator]
MSLPSKDSNSPYEVRSTENSNIQSHQGFSRWRMGILNDPLDYEVPGTILLLSEKHDGPDSPNPIEAEDKKKKTPDGKIVLNPQPEDHCNDPLNWKIWRKDAVLLSIGLYCMLGGGMTPILAAGYSNVASTFHVTVARVSLTTGLYMLGLGLGSFVVCPTAILYGKRPLYLIGSIIFVISSIWCAVASSFISLTLGRFIQGISVSPSECLPSATISEIYFLHERAYRIGIYSLLLLSGKNLMPLVSAVIIQSLSWRWVFWFTTFSVVLCGMLLFFFVPETFWDRTSPRNNSCFSKDSRFSLCEKDRSRDNKIELNEPCQALNEFGIEEQISTTSNVPTSPISGKDNKFIDLEKMDEYASLSPIDLTPAEESPTKPGKESGGQRTSDENRSESAKTSPMGNLESDQQSDGARTKHIPVKSSNPVSCYMTERRSRPSLSFTELLKPWNGRLTNSSWLQVAIRPFILFAYPAVLWSSIVYSCSIGWLIVISEGVTQLFRSEETYNFSALSAGLLYISPFIGGVIGTAMAGKLSDIIVQFMAKHNGNIFEPEFRLVMAIPTAITTVVGLMGFGWSIQIVDQWIVPAVFFGVVSFGCSLGAATAITFCVDSYRMYAGEALVTLNFSKNIFHGLVFSLFFTNWVKDDGPKTVFMWLGFIQLIVMGLTVPMYIFGKRARNWTLSQDFMEKL